MSNLLRQSWVTSLALFAVAALVYGQFGFRGEIVRDDAMSLYGGQLMARGIPPYVGIFDHKGPLGPMLIAAPVVVAGWFGWDDLLATRLLFLGFSCAAVVALFWLGRRVTGTGWAGALCAFAFLACYGYAQRAASGPQVKTPAILAQIACLLLLAEKRWFWAGLAGALAGLLWQPMAAFAAAALLLALFEPPTDRRRALAGALAGVFVPLALTGAYFLAHGALGELVEGALVFNMRYLDRPARPLIEQLKRPFQVLFASYGPMALPLLAGLAVTAWTYVWRWQKHRSVRALLASDPFAPVLLSFPAPVAWSLADFQGTPDSFVLLPYAALGFGLLLYFGVERTARLLARGRAPAVARGVTAGLCLALAIGGVATIQQRRDERLIEQRQAASAIEQRFGADVRLVSLGVPEALVLLHHENPSRFIGVFNGFDGLIHATTPGGFEGWLASLDAYDPDVVAVGVTNGQHADQLQRWLEQRFRREQLGPWTVYVRDRAAARSEGAD